MAIEIIPVEGRGLMLGVQLTKDLSHEVRDAAQANGLIVNAPTESRIRLVPPLIIGDAEIGEFMAKFTAALDAVSRSLSEVEGGRA